MAARAPIIVPDNKIVRIQNTVKINNSAKRHYSKDHANPRPSSKRCNGIPSISRAVVAGILLCLVVKPASAILVGWHDSMSLLLGDGVRLNHQDEPATTGLVILTNPVVTGVGQYNSENVTFSQHTYSMVKSLYANGSVSLNALIFQGDAGIAFFGKHTFSANDIVFVYTRTKDFGTTTYSPVDFSPTGKSIIAGFQKTLQGAALDSAITQALGTHYVRGYDSAAMVAVVYTFHFASSSFRQQMAASAGGSLPRLEAFVQTVFSGKGTNTTASMSYAFYSTDPTTNFNFGSVGTITSYQQYSNFLAQVRAYADGLTSANAKATQFILDPTQNVPGYLAILGGYIPPPVIAADYDPFASAYSALKAAKERMATWLLQGRSLNWLNAQGRQQLINQWNQIGSLLDNMKSIAAAHYTQGAPLTVPSAVTDFIKGYNELRLPQILYLDSFATGGDTYVIGRVACGCTNLTTPMPFYNVSALYYGTNYYTTSQQSYIPLFYNPDEFQTTQNATYGGTVQTHLTTLFTGPTWHSLTNSGSDVNGFFLVTQPTSKAANYTIEVDTLDTAGNTVAVDTESLLAPVPSTTDAILPCTLPIPLQ